MIAVGLMCGTSLDGIDVARVDVRVGERISVTALDRACVPLPAALRTRLIEAQRSPQTAIEFAALHAAVGAAFGAALASVARPFDVVGSHGITIAHDDRARTTLQIGDPFRIREAAGVTVVADFRSADTAAGGTGAPLVPHIDALLFGDVSEPRIALNLGGIANITVLRAGDAGRVSGCDTGPANMLIDALLSARTNGAETFDRNGARAARGRVDGGVLAALLNEPYFAAPAPKSTGRETFGEAFLRKHAAQLDVLSLDDALATLTALSATSIALAIASAAPEATRVIASGGGVHNATLMAALAAAMPGRVVELSARYGVDPDAKEAIAFAVLAVLALHERSANEPGVTGARGRRVLGSIAPVGLAAMLARIAAEDSRP